MLAFLHNARGLLLHPIDLIRRYPRRLLGADLTAGVSVGIVLLPQALAFSLLAGVPPEMGLYSAIVGAFVAALWGSSSHLNSGPTNTASILTLAVLLPLFEPGTPEFIAAAGLVAVMAGGIRLLMGLARLGILVNFVSDSVAAGFTAGAGILIIVNQLAPILRIDLPPTTSLIDTLRGVLTQIEATHLPSLALAIATIGLTMGVQRLSRRLPAYLIGISVVTLAAWLLNLEVAGIAVLGILPRSLPPLASLPLFDLGLMADLASAALALAIIGLVEAISIARAIAGYSRERIDSNQEFVGQGLANIAAGFFSGYPCSASFNRSALSHQAGARTPLANAFSGVFVLIAMFVLAPLMAHLPRAVLAGTLVLAASGMIDRRIMTRIWRSSPGDAVIMTITMAATLFLPLQFAVLIGVLMSLGYYLLQTSMPRVQTVLPTADFQHWRHQPTVPACPQLGVMEILGDLYFGAANHIEETIYNELQDNPRQRFLLLRMQSVQHCDISGIRALENIQRICRERAGDLFIVGVREPVLRMMKATSFYQRSGADRFLTEDQAIAHLFYKVIDPAVCIYECEVRAFRECQNLPKRVLHHAELPEMVDTAAQVAIPTVAPRELWEQLRDGAPPLVVDVREPREYQQGHIPDARLIPLPQLLVNQVELPHDRTIVLVCRSGRRSTRAAALLASRRHNNLAVLQGGMIGWEAERLLEAVEWPTSDSTEIPA